MLDFYSIHAVVTAEARGDVEAEIAGLLGPIRPGLVFEGIFTVQLSATGAGPATHYGTTSPIAAEDLIPLLLAAPAFGGSVALATREDTEIPGVPIAASLDALAAAIGLQRLEMTSPF